MLDLVINSDLGLQHTCKPEARSVLSGVRYAMVTPVRDEEAYIGEMINSIAAQSVPPSRWIIVDDGSHDRTVEIVSEHARRLDFLTLVQLGPRDQRRAGGEGAVPAALRRLDLKEFDYLARFDADLVFPRDYIEKILVRFASNPRLGIAGGTLYIEQDGRKIAERCPAVHVRGALKMYRRECFEAIGGLNTQIGWDTLDEAAAWAIGWETRSFDEIPALHCRPTGNGIAATALYSQRGRAEYLTWSDPFFVFAKAVRLALSTASIVNPVCYLSGFWAGYLRRAERIQNKALVKARRSQQHDTMMKALRFHRENKNTSVSNQLFTE